MNIRKKAFVKREITVFTSIINNRAILRKFIQTKHRLCGRILKIKPKKESICKKRTHRKFHNRNNLSVSNNT